MLLKHLGELVVAHDVRVEHEKEPVLVIFKQVLGGVADWTGCTHWFPLNQALDHHIVLLLILAYLFLHDDLLVVDGQVDRGDSCRRQPLDLVAQEGLIRELNQGLGHS